MVVFLREVRLPGFLILMLSVQGGKGIPGPMLQSFILWSSILCCVVLVCDILVRILSANVK